MEIAGGDPLVIVEGEADALACVWLYPGAEVWAVGGTSGANLAPGHSARAGGRYRSGPGRQAALKLDAALEDRAQIEWNRNGQDTADKWRAELLERAAILEFGGGLDRAAADRTAWDRPLREREKFSNRKEIP